MLQKGWFNGAESSSMPMDDRSALFGDSCFTTMAIFQGQPEFFDAHRRRLQTTAEQLRFPAIDWNVLRKEMLQACPDNANAVLRVMISRGQSQSGYRIAAALNANRYITRREFPQQVLAFAQRGITLTVCQTRLSQNATLAGLKHGNRLEQVLARAEWQDDNIVEGLMLDADDFVIEGTCSNVFFVDAQDRLCTPSLHLSGVAGIVRQAVLDEAELRGLTIQIADFTLADMENAKELFVCNCVMGIAPVTLLRDKRLNIGSTTRALQKALFAQRLPEGNAQ